MEEKILELNKMVMELRKKLEEKEAGRITEAQFKEFETKINDRIDKLEAAIKRPPAQMSPAPDEVKAAFMRYLRTGKIETKALVEDETGEILVPEQLMSELIRDLPKLTTVRPLARVIAVARSNRIRKRSINELQVGWGKLETGATITQSSFVPAEGYIYVEDLYGLTKIGEDELMDSDIALEALVTDSFARAIAAAEDEAFLVGTGHTNGQPEGVLNATGVTTVTTAAAGAITFDDVLELYYSIDPRYRANAVFICHSSTEKQLRKIKDQMGNYIWSPAVASGMPNTLFGRPIYVNDSMPEFAQNAKVLLFGDFGNGYVILDRRSLTVQRLNELYAEAGLVGFKVHYRVGGGVVQPKAFAVLKVKNA